MFSSYLDESFDETGRIKYPVFVIAGYFGLQNYMLQLHWNWEKKLKALDLPYFKARDCEFGENAFSKYRDDPSRTSAPLKPHERKRLQAIKAEFIQVVHDLRIQAVGFGAAVRTDHFQQLLRREQRAEKLFGPTPYFLCYQAVLMQAGLMAQNRNKEWKEGHMVAPIFDSHEQYSGQAMRMYNGFRQKNPICSKWLVDTLVYGDDKTYLCLQAADSLAYEIRKFANSVKYNPAISERIAWTAMKEKVFRVLLFDMPILRILLDHNVNMLDEQLMETEAVLSGDFPETMAPPASNSQ